ncbi:MAG: hypothetical protein DCC58_17865 [Chloroflexi bacterium]|nr:MAG: hypothetical protein DCC58_17865 [Chloroflexota bacterium]
MQCPACEHTNPDGTKFCFSCGTRLQTVCPSCGVELPPGARFCGECGTATSLQMPAIAASSTPRPPLPESFAGGRYAVKRFLGEGGKKQVYLVHDTRLARDVAFSLIKTEGLDATGIERVRREAQVMARLGGHPHIVSVYDMGDEAGRPYLVSELMGGGDVEGLLAASPDHRLPLADTLRAVEQICLALEHAHTHGIIHRDLKPGNVWLTSDGTAKLGDFGLALAIDRTRLSVAGMIVGTLAYTPPEQALGRPPDARSDLYSLGAMLYEMTTGRPPFLGDDPVAIIGQHLNTAPVAPSWHNRDLPKPLEALTLALLAKNPAERPASAGEVRAQVAALAAALSNGSAAPTDADTVTSPNPLDRLAGGVFVGREAEATALRAALDDALAGNSQTALLVGEPGIGKTRLAEELGTYAALRGAQVLWGRCYEWEGTPAYWPWVQIIRAYVHERDPQGLRSELGAGAGDVAEIVSEIRERLPGLPASPATQPDQARFRLFDSIATFLSNASRHQPLMLVLDDLHWADRPSLLLLEFLTRELRAARVLLLGTYRDVELGRHHPLSQTLAELSRSRATRRIVLRGLLETDVERYIALSAGITPPEGLPAAVHRETEGNPFFMAEVVRLLVAEGRLEQSDTARRWSVSLPESVREVIGKRLNQLSEECNRVLAVGSVIGREFRLATLERVTGRSAEDLLDLLEVALQARVIEELDSVGQFRFSHALVQETLYAELSAARKARLHSQIGDAIVQLQIGNITPYLGEIAQHYFEAAAAGKADDAIAYGLRAAVRAMEQFAWEAAARLYQQVLHVVELREPVDKQQRLEVLFALAMAQIRSGTGDRASVTFMQAIELGRRLGAVETLADAIAHQGNLTLTLNIPGREDLVAELLERLPPGDSFTRVQLLRWVITWAFFETREQRMAMFNDVVAMARRLGDPRAQAAVLTSRGFGLKDAYSAQERLDNARELLDLAKTADDNDLTLTAILQLHSAHMELGDVTAARSTLTELHALAERLRTPFARWYVLVHRGLHALLQGDFAEAERLAIEVLPLGRMIWAHAVGEPETIYARHLHLIRRERGGLDELVPLYQAIAEQHPYDLVRRSWPYLLTMLYADLGWEAQTRTLFEQVAADDFTNIGRRAEISITFFATLAVTCAYLGDVRQAARLYDFLLPRSGEAICFFGVYTCYGAVDYYLGLLATTLERWNDAEQHFADALAMHERMGARPFAAHTRYAWAEMLAQQDVSSNRERAVALLDETLVTCDQLGMPVLAERALGLKVRLQGILRA